MVNLIYDVFFQGKNPRNFRFYKLALGLEKISTTNINYNDHITLNKKLPEETIYKIVSYLSMKDILHLCLSKVFMPCLVNSPWFFKKRFCYFTHLLGYTYSTSQNLFILCALYPAMLNNEFYFSVDLTKLPYFKKLFNGRNTIFSLYKLEPILKVWFILFQPYKRFKLFKRYYLKTIHSFPNCHQLCPCLQYNYVAFRDNTLLV